MTFLATCGQCVLVLLNIVFVLISLALVAVGVVLKFFPGTFMQFLFKGLQATVPFELPTGSDNLDIVPLVDNIGLVLIVIGVILFGLCFLACCGACCRWRIFLVLFCILVILLMIAIATVGGLLLARDSVLHQNIKAGLKQRVHDEYMGPGSGDIFTLAINIMSHSMNCCAITGPDDFNSAANWTTYVYDGNTYTLGASPACCTNEYLRTNQLAQCTQKPFIPERIHTQGCYAKLLDLIEGQRRWVILGLVLVLVFLATEVVFSIVLIKDINDSNTHPI